MRRRLAIGSAVVVLLAACGSSGSSSPVSTPPAPSGSAPSSSGTAAAPSDNSSLSAAELGTAALAALTSATSFHIVATATNQGTTTAYEAYFGRTVSQAEVQVGKTAVQVVLDGSTAYVRATDDYWTSQVKLNAAALKVVSKKFVRVLASDTRLASAISFATRATFLVNLRGRSTPATFQKAPPLTLNKVDLVGFTVPATGQTVYVAATGSARPVQILVPTGSTANGVSFDRYDEPFALTRPAAALIVDGKTAGLS